MTRRKKLVVLVVIVVLFIGVSLLMTPPVSGPRAPGPRAECQFRMHLISLALESYRSARRHYPPAVVYDESGKPMHSWRALILPFMEYGNSSIKYDVNEPWNSPNNLAVAEQLDYDLFFCPGLQEKDWLGNRHKPEKSFANYVVITGPGTAFDGADGKHPRDFKDGFSNTILFVEFADSEFQLLEPRDITAEEFIAAFENASSNSKGNSGNDKSKSASNWNLSRHKGGLNVGFADGSVRFIEFDTPSETIRAMPTIAGGEVVEPF